MSYRFRLFCVLGALAATTRVGAAQATTGLDVLSIPERQPITCSFVKPTRAELRGTGLVTQRFEIGPREHIGGDPATPVVAPRDVELLTDARGGIFVLDKVRRSDGGDVVTVGFGPNSRPGLWRTIKLDRAKVQARLERGDFTPAPPEQGAISSRPLTAPEKLKADSLAQWLLKRGCTP